MSIMVEKFGFEFIYVNDFLYFICLVIDFENGCIYLLLVLIFGGYGFCLMVL